MSRPSGVPIQGELYTTEAGHSRAVARQEAETADPDRESAEAAMRENKLCRRHGKLLCETCRPPEDTTR